MKNLLPVVNLVAEFGNVVDDMGRSSGGARYAAAIQMFDELAALGSVDFSKVDDEFREALQDTAKLSQVQAAFADKFDIEDDQLEAFVEEGIILVREHYELVKKDIDFAKRIKALKKS